MISDQYLHELLLVLLILILGGDTQMAIKIKFCLNTPNYCYMLAF